MSSPEAQPLSLADIQHLTPGMDEVELAQGIFLMQQTIPLQRHAPVGTALDHGNVIQAALLTFGTSLQGLYH